MKKTAARRLCSSALLVLATTLPLTLVGCKLLLGEPSKGAAGGKKGQATADPKVLVPKPLTIKTFTDAVPATTLLGSGSTIWEGTARGLLQWDTTKGSARLVPPEEGVPAGKVVALTLDPTGALWVVTPAGVGHLQGPPKPGWKVYPLPTVGEIAGITVAADGAAWVGGDKGLMKLNVKKGTWDAYLGATAVTCVTAAGNDVWVGTRKNGIAHIVPDKKADRVDAFGPDQGADFEKVTQLAATPTGVMAVGESKIGQRLAYFDGFRFWSYRLEGMETKIQWLRRVGSEALIGSGKDVWTVKRADSPAAPAGIKAAPASVAVAAPPLSGLAKAEPPVVIKQPEKPGAPATKAAFEAPVAAKPDKGKKGKPATAAKAAAAPAKADPNAKPVTAVAKPAEPAAPAPAAAPGPGKDDRPGAAKADLKAKDAAKPAADPKAKPADAKGKDAAAAKPAEAPAEVAPEKPAGPPPPGWEVAAWGNKIPDETVAISPDGATLLVATRYNGIVKVEQDVTTEFRQNDIAADGDRLYVACDTDTECWYSTGLDKPWHWNGKGFDLAANIDTDEGAKVMLVINPPNGGPIALSHGPKDNGVRVAQNNGGKWSPIILRDLQVPTGVPDITFASFNGSRMWLGLRYIDKLGDATDFGAAEVDLAKDDVKFHRTVGAMGATSESLLWPLPNDLTTSYFRLLPSEMWFGTRTGMVRVKDGQSTRFGEAELGFSESVKDFADGPGLDKRLWAATAHGVAAWDEKKWVYPAEGNPLKVKAVALVKDKFGWVWVGSPSGLWLYGPPDPNTNDKYSVMKIEAKRGLADDRIVDLALDRLGRVWALTEKGLSVLER